MRQDKADPAQPALAPLAPAEANGPEPWVGACASPRWPGPTPNRADFQNAVPALQVRAIVNATRNDLHELTLTLSSQSLGATGSVLS